MSDQATKPEKPSKSGSETRQRQAALRLRVTDAERAEIEARANRAGLSVSGYLRALVFGKDTPQPRAARRPPVEFVELVRLRGVLGKIGGNVNQIAHHLNRGEETPLPIIAAALAEVIAVSRAISAALGRKPKE